MLQQMIYVFSTGIAAVKIERICLNLRVSTFNGVLQRICIVIIKLNFSLGL
jgi:hypothetical protein